MFSGCSKQNLLLCTLRGIHRICIDARGCTKRMWQIAFGLYLCGGSLFAVSAQTIGQREQRMGYSVQIADVPLAHGDTAQGYLLLPETTSVALPAVVLLHDHGAYFSIGKEKMVYPLCRVSEDSTHYAHRCAESRYWTEKYYEGMFLGDSLAAAGYVVLVIDACYWGERQRDSSMSGREQDIKAWNKRIKYNQPAYYYRHLQTYGETWFETILRDDRACVDYLCSLPQVDSMRIGVCGFSMGGFRAWQLAAVDARLKVCVAANWMTTKVDHLGVAGSPEPSRPSAYAMYSPDERDYPQIASQIVPRPFLLLCGDNDLLFPPDSVLKAVDAIRVRYSDAGATEYFRCVSIPTGHCFSNIHWQHTLRFFKENL